jgi:hypothetical protein
VGGLKVVHYIPIPPRSLTLWPDLDEKEQRLFYEFQTRAGLELAGVHNAEFWLRYVVHIGLSEPAIKHAVIGVAALHQQFRSSKKLTTLDECTTTYALREYTRSISLLASSMKAGSMEFSDSPLVACVLYCAFESMSYHLHSAISHAGSGIKIYMERKRSAESSRQSSIPAYILTPLYIRLDIQGLELGETTFVRQSQVQTQVASGFAPFRSINDAQTTFDHLTNAILHAIYDIDRAMSHNSYESSTTNPTTKATLQDLIRTYCQWCKEFDSFVSRQATACHLAACLLLQVWRILLVINLRVDLRDGEMDFDRFDTEFRAIVDLCSAFILAQSKLPLDLKQPDSVVPYATDTPRSKKQQLYHLKSNNNGLRGGYLGIDSRCTPFARDGIFEMDRTHTTTEHLLRMARSYRQLSAASLGRVEDACILSHDLEPSYCFSPGVVSPLYVAISRCRDPCIRRRALALMQRCKRREGLWDADLAARLGQRVIEIEEQCAKELSGTSFESPTALSNTSNITSSIQIPNEARVRMIKPTFLPDRRSIERYYLGFPAVYDDSGCIEETWIEEIMEW